ncbi:alpha/beta hydrolase [Amycolatopsis sp. DG1A-15b]|uniref:alpha/beta fold hydrolase n=1 Tax=Amycolatopsis sp. DG1A-15b TaxID=3052846 RepID=UPI00255C1628|nr:alpha/beta hydrolase [Amycolatopsis sp. DG1A-15b]WIX91385.1 alpha/beta hydrolase [Amycolatopsis sp. DG1A-15b]
MDADQFWALPGVTGGIRRAGFPVLAPNRLHRPPNWHAESEHLAAFLPEQPVAVVAGSNGCSAATRLALAFPTRIARLLLAWPATAGDITVDSHTRAGLAASGASDQNIRALLDGQTLRGVTDNELATLTMPVSVLPSAPENPFHQRRTVDSIRRLLPGSEELYGCPEPPRPDFPSHLDRLLASITKFADR